MNVSSLSFSFLFGARDDFNPKFLTRFSMPACILTMGVLGFLGGLNPCSAIAANQEGKPGSEKLMVLRLSLDDAIAMFLHQNLNLLKAKYGIETAKAKKITAGLFPNPEFSLETLSAYYPRLPTI